MTTTPVPVSSKYVFRLQQSIQVKLCRPLQFNIANVNFEITRYCVSKSKSHHKRGIASRRADVCRLGAIISPSGQLFVLASGEGLQQLPGSVVSAAPATLHLQAPPGH